MWLVSWLINNVFAVEFDFYVKSWWNMWIFIFDHKSLVIIIFYIWTTFDNDFVYIDYFIFKRNIDVIRLGEFNTSSKYENYVIPWDYTASEVIYHPDYKAGSSYHDLALVRLNETIHELHVSENNKKSILFYIFIAKSNIRSCFQLCKIQKLL